MISTIPEKKSMVLEFDQGIFDGKRKTTKKSYTIKNGVTKENIHAVALAIGQVVNYELLKVYEQDLNILVKS